MLSSIEIQSFTFIVGFQEVQSENWKLKLSQIPKIFTIHNWTLIFRVNCTEFITLDSGINVPPGITVAPPLKNFYITILILFYINLGIAVIFKFFLSSKFFKN